jgi:hypothetical protein
MCGLRGRAPRKHRAALAKRGQQGHYHRGCDPHGPEYIMFETSERYQMDDADGMIYLIMPYRKQWHQIFSLFIGILLSGCMMIPIIIILYTSGMAHALFTEQPVALILPFMLFGILLLVAFIEIIWQLTGREIITITDEYFQIRHQIPGFGVTKKIPAARISEVHVSGQPDLWHAFWTRRSSAFWDYKRGRISINCERTILGEVQTYRFGSILDTNDSKHIVETILERFPRYALPPGDMRKNNYV